MIELTLTSKPVFLFKEFEHHRRQWDNFKQDRCIKINHLNALRIDYLILSDLGDVGLQCEVIHSITEVFFNSGKLSHGKVSERFSENWGEGKPEIGANSAETLSKIHCLEANVNVIWSLFLEKWLSIGWGFKEASIVLYLITSKCLMVEKVQARNEKLYLSLQKWLTIWLHLMIEPIREKDDH